MGRTLAMSQFLGHQTRSGGSSQFLRGWRKRNPAEVHVVLHQNAPIVALWQHGLPRIFEQKDEKRGSVTRRVFGGSFNCLEDEAVLLKQYRRDRDTGERQLPPVICPVCRLLESLRQLYADGVLGFCDTIFRWEGDDPNETQVLTLGGMLNLYGKDELGNEEKAAMSEAKIKLSEAWKENSWAKCNYLFCVVDADEPDEGVQLAIETTALGDATKECIHNQMTSLGEAEGNPMITPYAIKWEHRPKADSFAKRYKAIAMPRIPITDQISELIEGDPPDIGGVIKPGNITKLRAELEARCVLEDPDVISWDDIFGPAEQAGLGTDEESEQVEDDAETATAVMASKRAAKTTAKPATASRRRKKAPEPDPEEEEEVEEEEVEEEEASHEDGTIPCDECGAPMPADATTCEACGAEYTLEEDEEEAEEEEAEEEEEEEAPPPPAKKTTAKKTTAKKTTAKKTTAKKAPAKKTGRKIPF